MRILYTILTRRIIIMALLLMIAPALWAQRESKIYTGARTTEVKADRYFIRGNYQRAMKFYERANDKLPQGVNQKLALELKMARLYNLLQQSEQAIKYYQIVHNSADTMLTVNDVCFFIDALRRENKSQQAEIVARTYAFTTPYSRNQRYLNTLNSLSNQQHYYGRGDADYSVKMLEASGALPEYWIGELQGKPFYAASHSPIQDLLKVFYHRTQYFNLDGNVQYEQFRSIPRELQSGPMAFADNDKLMIATGISYKEKDKISDPGADNGLYATQLYYSFYDTRRDGWSSFLPLFDYQQGSSYAHPTFFNDGKSLMFSSDRPGGQGGMDLYMTHWNEATQKWGEPINMGVSVNTEGDEIYPRIAEGVLYFSSNGHEGFGGYDIYRVSFGHNLVLPGSLLHFPYPINTTYNDFGIYYNDNAGYFISDRRGIDGKDDIYVFDNTISALNSSSAVGVSAEYSAMRGNLNQISGMKASNTHTFEKELLVTPTYVIPQQGEVMLSLYFDFNHDKLDMESVSKLNELLQNPGFHEITEISVIGYADEFGSDNYNKNLSERRAQSVAKFLIGNGATPKMCPEGKGRVQMTQQEYIEELHNLGRNMINISNTEMQNSQLNYLTIQDRIALNRKLRRVDIVVKSK